MNNSNRTLASLGSASSVSQFYAETQEEINRKKQLAEKMMTVKGLTKEEKHEIYITLTGEAPAKVKRGRHPYTERDKGLAYDYLIQKHYKKWTGIDKLVEKHKIPKDDPTTFYKAVERGIKALDVEITRALKKQVQAKEDCPELKNDPELNKLIKFGNFCLDLIEYHRNVKKPGKK